jgi:hypothetical protein
VSFGLGEADIRAEAVSVWGKGQAFTFVCLPEAELFLEGLYTIMYNALLQRLRLYRVDPCC